MSNPLVFNILVSRSRMDNKKNGTDLKEKNEPKRILNGNGLIKKKATQSTPI